MLHRSWFDSFQVQVVQDQVEFINAALPMDTSVSSVSGYKSHWRNGWLHRQTPQKLLGMSFQSRLRQGPLDTPRPRRKSHAACVTDAQAVGAIDVPRRAVDVMDSFAGCCCKSTVQHAQTSGST